MSDIHVVKLNEAIAQVHCDPGIGYELSEQFKFRPPNFQFMPAFQNKMWDGYIRLFDRRTHQIPIGLVPKLAVAASDLQYTISYDEDVFPQVSLKKTDFAAYIHSLKLTDGKKDITPYAEQYKAVYHALNNEKALLLSPTSSGKSLIIYLIVRYLLDNNIVNKFLIVAPTTTLVDQIYKNFQEYSINNKWDAKNLVHTIYSGKDKQSDCPVVVSTWQSIHRLHEKYFRQYDGWIVDEAHHADGKSLQAISNKCTNAFYRLGLTGSTSGDKVDELVLTGSFGPIENITTTDQLIKDDKISDVKIQCMNLIYSDEESKKVRKLKYQDEIKFILGHGTRNKFLCNLAKSRKGNTLVLFNRIDHGKFLTEALRKKSGKQVFYVDKDVSVEKRSAICEIAEERDDVIIVASYQTFSTGINIRNLHHVIFAAPFKGRIRLLQSIGRVLRKYSGKEIATVYDIVDNLKVKKYKNYCLKHFLQRVKIYGEQKFNYRIHKINLQ